LQRDTGESQSTDRTIDINTETLIAWTYFKRHRTGFAGINFAGFTQVAAMHSASKIMTVQKSGFFYFSGNIAQFDVVVVMNQKDPLVFMDSRLCFLETKPPGTAFDSIGF